MVIEFLEYDSICQGESDLIRTSVGEILSARAGAAQSSSIFMQIWFASEKCGTDHKDTEQILQHYKSRSFLVLCTLLYRINHHLYLLYTIY